ncbi:beta-galactosidase [Agrobacterium salinitolerans]|uniref:beta-galactosidase n=1 Tax=Agrobacterium salinitolerans TaxID=1183413 RepID=UPI00098EA443|nr:beta-galactosidase [Agrobacterium salinitolerans]OOO27712.1 beta-galactosidase [Agrobacterium salinitolerans]PNQ25613.1 beta-galactosidase [Rhizobium sp. YIC5082]
MSIAPSRAPSAWRATRLKQFLIGSAHYPEHVDRSYWERDAERMANAGFRVARLAEFAWHILEPREGEFDFSLFDDAIAVLARHGISTIMCTPTATPPRWLTHRYPEVLRVDEKGRPASHGSRQHADTTSPVYRLHSKRISEAMARHYANNPNVIGWQTDNELNTSTSLTYSEGALREFKVYLEQRYGTIEKLNHAWGGDFWATAFDSFDQVVFPIHELPVSPGPGHIQDYHRFLAHATARFQLDQIEIIRKANASWFVFHNLGRLNDIDFRGDFSRELDFMGYDVYPFLLDEGQRIGSAALSQALSLDMFRGFSGNFIVPEQQVGFGAQSLVATVAPEPGEMRRMALSSVARGADGIIFFRWRAAHFGAEIYWMGIIDHDDVPRRRYNEAAEFARDLISIENHILGTHVRIDVGIAGGDFDNQEAHRTYPMGLPSPQDEAIRIYKHCYQQGIACGFVHPDDDIERLKVLIVPHWVMWQAEWTKKIAEYAQKGGTVVFTALSATRDENNHVLRETAPGFGVGDLCGVKVEEIGRLPAPGDDGLSAYDDRHVSTRLRTRHPATSAERVHTVTIGNKTVSAGYFYERLSIQEGTQVIGTWSSRFVAGEPSITSRDVGRGRAVYVGTYLTEELVSAVCDRIFPMAEVEPLVQDLPSGVEVSMREDKAGRFLFVINTTEHAVCVPKLPHGKSILLDGEQTANEIKLRPYGGAVLKLS